MKSMPIRNSISSFIEFLSVQPCNECTSDQAADDLKMKNLMDLTCQTLMHRIDDKTPPAAIRYFLNMVNKYQVRLAK